ncbi:MAG: hypothetical protein ACTSQI_09170 [Candidatus Helarchaeota archaeon]
MLQEIRPTDQENQALTDIFNSLQSKLQLIANQLKIAPKFIQNHGSTGIKQTHLRGTSDLDIFIGLDPDNYSDIIELPSRTRKQALKKLFLSYVEKWFIPAAKAAELDTFQISYAEHPYLSIMFNQYEIDIVGCFDLDYEYIRSHGPITAVDRTPWHSKIVSEKLTGNQKDDVRLFKAFLQANHVYGDKKTIGRLGFTGFSAEVLILYYKTLEDLFLNFKNLENSALDFFERSSDVLRTTKRFERDFLIIIDPVDMNRNLAASISERAYRYALLQIQRFELAPSIQYFLKKPIGKPPEKNRAQLAPHLVIIEFTSDGTTHYTELRDKLYSACMKLMKLLEQEGTGEERFGETFFEVYFEDKIFVATFYCKNIAVAPVYLRKGPSKKRSTNVKKFCAKHPDAILKNGFYYVPIQREFLTPISLVTHFFHDLKSIKGLSLTTISQEATSSVGQRALSLFISCVLPLYGVIPS